MENANYSPVYHTFYQQLVNIAREHGYVLVYERRSMSKLNITAFPWIPRPPEVSLPQTLMDEITKIPGVENIAESPTTKEDGELTYALNVYSGELFCYFSFKPILTVN